MSEINITNHDSNNTCENTFFTVSNSDSKYLRMEVSNGPILYCSFDDKYKNSTNYINSVGLGVSIEDGSKKARIELSMSDDFKQYLEDIYNSPTNKEGYLYLYLYMMVNNNEERMLTVFRSREGSSIQNYDGNTDDRNFFYISDFGLTLSQLMDSDFSIRFRLEGLRFYNSDRTDLKEQTFRFEPEGYKSFTQNISTSVSDIEYSRHSFYGNGELTLNYTNGNSDTINLEYDYFSIHQDNEATGPWDTSGCSQSNWCIHINGQKRYCSSDNGNLASYSFSGNYFQDYRGSSNLS